MNESEARSKIKYRIEVAREIAGNGVNGKAFEDLEIAIEALKEIREYRKIGTVEELKALKEKNEPKKMLYNGANWYRCPNGCEIHKKQFEKDWYCPKCGQKLDWSV